MNMCMHANRVHKHFIKYGYITNSKNNKTIT